MKTLQFLHFADLHLGSPLGKLSPSLAERVREDQKQFLRSLKDLCAVHEAQLLLIAGDLFDHPYPEKSLADFVAHCLAELTDTQVYIAPGNHDPLLSDSVWHTTAWPENVHLFTDTCTRFENDAAGVCIEGTAYTGFHADAPLLVASGPPYDGYRILLWHGELATGETRYNPLHPHSPFFSDYDYIALGHIHQANTVSSAAAYPGFVQGRGFDELGPGGLTLVQLQGKRVATQRLAHPGVRFEIVEADVSGAQTGEEVFEKVQEAIDEAAGTQPVHAWLKHTALRLHLTGDLPEGVFVNPDILATRLQEFETQDLSIRDRTRIAADLHAVAEEAGLRGRMAKNLLRRKEQAADPFPIDRAFDLLLRAERKEPLSYED